MTASALYTGTVRHRRCAPPAREFCHRITLAYLDYDEHPDILARRCDVLAADDLRALVGDPAPSGPIRVLTMPRTFGVSFNPVTFYYLFDGDALDSVVAEVTSTPWGKRQTYVLRGGGPVLRGSHAKRLHVSPFQPMDRRHEWTVTEPGETLSVHIENHGDTKDFDATLKLRRRPLGRRATPPLRTLALIYGHALALKLRGARHFRPEGA